MCTLYTSYMVKQTQRHIAIQAARSQLRSMGFTTDEMTSQSAQEALDDLSRSEPELVASEWYAEASNNQVKLFNREWKAWQRRGY